MHQYQAAGRENEGGRKMRDENVNEGNEEALFKQEGHDSEKGSKGRKEREMRKAADHSTMS